MKITFEDVRQGTDLAAAIEAKLDEYERHLRDEYGDGEPTRKLVAEARFELIEFCDWLRGK